MPCPSKLPRAIVCNYDCLSCLYGRTDLCGYIVNVLKAEGKSTLFSRMSQIVRIFSNPVCQLTNDISGPSSYHYFFHLWQTCKLNRQNMLPRKTCPALIQNQSIGDLDRQWSALSLIQETSKETTMTLKLIWTRNSTTGRLLGVEWKSQDGFLLGLMPSLLYRWEHIELHCALLD
jgi:hypothetical protein